MNELLTSSVLAIRATTAEVNSARPDAPVVPVQERTGGNRLRAGLAGALGSLAEWVQPPAPRIDVRGHR